MIPRAIKTRKPVPVVLGLTAVLAGGEFVWAGFGGEYRWGEKSVRDVWHGEIDFWSGSAWISNVSTADFSIKGCVYFSYNKLQFPEERRAALSDLEAAGLQRAKTIVRASYELRTGRELK
ncbi:hypothetical protein BC938DRAFT_477052, partial [Jimgerdemannia flammicorona]